jgi:hypothetical protein
LLASRFLRRIFGLYPGEGKSTFHFARLTVTWTFGMLMADTLSMSLFIQNVGSQTLPVVYTCTAIGMIVVSSFIIYLLKYVSALHLYRSILTAGSLFYLTILSILFFNPPPTFWIVLQILTPLFTVATNATFWSFLDHYHDLQDAKRVYGIYNSCYFLGLMFSGIAINQLIHITGIKFFYGCTVIALFLANIQAKKIVNNYNLVEDDLIDEATSNKRKFSTLIEAFIKSPFSLLLVVISLIIQLLITTTEYSYMSVLDNHFHKDLLTNPNVIAEFLSKVKAFIAFGNILFSMLIYRRCISRFGLQNMIFLPPLVFVTIYTQWLCFEGLWLAIMGVIAIEGVLYSIEDSNFNLLTNVASSKLKGILRLINDSFFEPIGTLLAAICLLFLHSHAPLFGFSLAFVFLIGVVFVKRNYAKSLGENLKQNAMHLSYNLKNLLSYVTPKEHKEILQDIKTYLKKGDEKTRLLLIQYVLESEDKQLFYSLFPIADTLSNEGKLTFIKMVDNTIFSRDAELMILLETWQKKERNPHLLRWIRFYLMKKGAIPTQLNIDKAALSNDHIYQALQLLKEEESKENFERAVIYLNHNSDRIKLKSAEILAQVASNEHLPHAPKLFSYLRSSSHAQLRLYLLEALGKMQDLNTTRHLILSSLHLRPNEKRLLETLVYPMGRDAIELLSEIIADTHQHDHSRIIAAKILGKISLETLQSLLNEVLLEEISRAYFYFYYSQTLQEKYPHLNLSLLIHSLKTSYQSAIDFILYLLGTSNAFEDSDLLVHILRGTNAKSHADAIEILEKTCKKPIFQKLLPLLDNIPLQGKLDAYSHYFDGQQSLSLNEVLDRLEQSNLSFDRTIGSYMKAKLNANTLEKPLNPVETFA